MPTLREAGVRAWAEEQTTSVIEDQLLEFAHRPHDRAAVILLRVLDERRRHYC